MIIFTKYFGKISILDTTVNMYNNINYVQDARSRATTI